MTDKEMIEARCQSEGLTIKEWTETDDGDTAKLGRWVVATDEFDGDGLYHDDEGDLTACVVGSEEFHNRRVHFSFTADGYDTGNEVRVLAALEPVDD